MYLNMFQTTLTRSHSGKGKGNPSLVRSRQTEQLAAPTSDIKCF